MNLNYLQKKIQMAYVNFVRKMESQRWRQKVRSWKDEQTIYTKRCSRKVRTLSAFDYLKNYAPDLLVKMEELIIIIEIIIPYIFPMENGIGGHKVKAELLH